MKKIKNGIILAMLVAIMIMVLLPKRTPTKIPSTITEEINRPTSKTILKKEQVKPAIKTVNTWIKEGAFKSTVQKHDKYKISYEYQQKGQLFIDETIWSVYIVVENNPKQRIVINAKSTEELLNKVDELPSEFDFTKEIP